MNTLIAQLLVALILGITIGISATLFLVVKWGMDGADRSTIAQEKATEALAMLLKSQGQTKKRSD